MIRYQEAAHTRDCAVHHEVYDVYDGESFVGIVRCKDITATATEKSQWYAFKDSEADALGTYATKAKAAAALRLAR